MYLTDPMHLHGEMMGLFGSSSDRQILHTFSSAIVLTPSSYRVIYLEARFLEVSIEAPSLSIRIRLKLTFSSPFVSVSNPVYCEYKVDSCLILALTTLGC